MTALARRHFMKIIGGAAALGLAGVPVAARAAYVARVVVVGGGYGGATAAKYLRMADPRIEVVLIEKNTEFVSCPGSNELLSGERGIEKITFRYNALAHRYGIKVVHGEVTELDPVNRRVRTSEGREESFDRVVVSPGIDFKWNAIEGYDQAASRSMPHAWSSGSQTEVLRRQLEAMDDGGTVVIVAPSNPFRCPAAPYERASQIAHYLKEDKPASKILILDAKSAFSMQSLFYQGWDLHYPGMITWIPAHEDGKVLRIDPQTRTLFTDFEEHRAQVVNVIPPQQAGLIAQRAGLTDESGWCPVNQQTFESVLHSGVHVIGDACIAGAMPKTAYSANSQAKVCAAAVAALVNANTPPEPSFINTCYGLIAPEHAVSVATVYRLVDGKIERVEGAGGESPLQASEFDRGLEARYARSWFGSITSDAFS